VWQPVKADASQKMDVIQGEKKKSPSDGQGAKRTWEEGIKERKNRPPKKCSFLPEPKNKTGTKSQKLVYFFFCLAGQRRRSTGALGQATASTHTHTRE